MIDSIVIVQPIIIPSHLLGIAEPFQLYEMVFYPSYNKAGKLSHFFTQLSSGLRIKLMVDAGKLVVMNSLHKAKHGYNATDFTLSELEESVAEVSELLHLDISHGIIKKLEYGCNIVPADASAVFNSLLSLRGKAYQPMCDRGKQYGAHCVFRHATLKVYDKRYVAMKQDLKLQDPILRFEIIATNMLYLHGRAIPIAIQRVEDLLKNENMQALGNDLVEKYRLSLKGPLLNIRQAGLRGLTAVARMSQPQIKEELKMHHRSTYDVDKGLYRSIALQNQSGEHLAIEKLLTDKVQYLLNN